MTAGRFCAALTDAMHVTVADINRRRRITVFFNRVPRQGSPHIVPQGSFLRVLTGGSGNRVPRKSQQDPYTGPPPLFQKRVPSSSKNAANLRARTPCTFVRDPRGEPGDAKAVRSAMNVAGD